MHTLRDLIDDYAMTRGIEASTADQLIYAVRSYEQHLGRTATLEDLRRDLINPWIESMGRDGAIAPKTAAGKRAAIKSLWTYAIDAELPGVGPLDRIRSVKQPQKIVRAWTLREVEQILGAAASLDRTLYTPTGVQYRVYFVTLFEVAYYTGLPRCDLMRVTVDAFRSPSETGTDYAQLSYVRRKTSRLMTGALPAKTWEEFVRMAYRIRRDGHATWERPLYWTKSLRLLHGWVTRIVRTAGVALQGGLHCFRRTGATQATIAGLNPAMYLNHADPKLARQCYVDITQLNVSVVPPAPRWEGTP